MRKFLFIIMTVCLSAQAFAQTSGEPRPSVIVERLTGQDFTCALAQIGKLTFANDSVYLIALDGAILGREAVAKTRSIRFDNVEEPAAAPEVSAADIRVFPNPASDHLTISGLDAGTTIRIYANDGKLLEVTTAEGTTTVLPVSHLAQGTYLLQINTSIVKFIKK